MQALLLVAVFFAVMEVRCQGADSPAVVTSAAVLRWAAQPDSAGFLVRVYDGPTLVYTHRVGDAKVRLKDVLGKLIPGEYSVRIVAVGEGGGVSEPSAPMSIIWVGKGLG